MAGLVPAIHVFGNKGGGRKPAVFVPRVVISCSVRDGLASLGLLGCLLLLRADAADRLDLERWPAGFFGDFAILRGDERLRRFVAVQPAKELGRHAAVGALGIVFIDDVEEGEFAFGIGSGLFWHARLVTDQDAAVKSLMLALVDASGLVDVGKCALQIAHSPEDNGAVDVGV
jgi:hypothetical protein